MNGKEITELDQRLLVYTIDRLNNKYDSVEDLVKLWKLFGPCIERCPKPEVRRPWMAGLHLND